MNRLDLLGLQAYEARAQQAEEQQLLEPPYEGTPPTGRVLGIDHETRNLLEASSQGSGTDERGRAPREEESRTTETPRNLVARVEPRAEGSPDRLSIGVASEQKRKDCYIEAGLRRQASS